MTLDINTPRGQETLAQERRVAEIVAAAAPGVAYLGTPKGEPAAVDAILTRGTDLIAVAETKCRNLTREQLAGYGDEWLVTWDKIMRARSVALGLGVPLIGFLYLTPEDRLLSLRITDASGALLVPIRIESTLTQATVNGGTARRNNAYLSLASAREIATPRHDSTGVVANDTRVQ